MNNALLHNTLTNLNVPVFIQRADNAALARMLATVQNKDISQPTPEKLLHYAFLYEKQGIVLYREFSNNPEKRTRQEIYDSFLPAYTCWRTISLLPEKDTQAVNGHISAQSLSLVEEDLQEKILSPALFLAFHLSVTGMLGGRTAETRLDLERFPLSENTHSGIWRELVLENIFAAFTLLVRKGRGWQDVRQAMSRLSTLRQLQQIYEEKYLQKLESSTQRTMAALELVGLYNLAQLITLAGEYLRTGQPGIDRVNTRLNRHYEQTIEALEVGNHLLLAHMADLLWIGCKELVQNSTWTHISSRLSSLMQEYVQWLISSKNERPLLELWPGQQEALRNHLLDPYQRAIIVSMPTSAGKTQLAKFAIMQAKGPHPDGLIVYVVPTRALVNQVTLDLRMDFRHLLHVEQTIPVTELDPTEDQLLHGRIDVLVTTPEKLDLLVKSKHPIVNNIILVIADEAHNLNDGERGVRLELLLGTIKLDFPGVQFLLLSPFLPNAQELAQWLGGEQALQSIKIDWKPNRKLIGIVRSTKQQRQWNLEFETLKAVDMQDIHPAMKFIVGQTPEKLHSIYTLTKATAQNFVKRGTVLVLCRGAGTAIKRAGEIARERPLKRSNEKLEAFCHYVEAELGGNSSLPYCLRHGVAYHHSGLSPETKWLIEDLIRDGTVEIVCGTTTLAQGMNFPITTVIIETLQKGREKLTPEDFRNVAGRAGRTLVDTLGVVVFPVSTPAQRHRVEELLKKDAQAVVSQLIAVIEKAAQMGNQFTLAALRENPGFSSLLQFLGHAMRVAENANLADEVEELLRSSLVYYQLQKQNQDLARALLHICRSYIEQTHRRKDILHLADQTGFATPSVLALLTQKKNREFSLPNRWSAERLFGEDLQPLIDRINAIAHLPEILLDSEKDMTFNGQLIAQILRAWVNGSNLEEMTLLYGNAVEELSLYGKKSTDDPSERLANFSKYLFSLLSRISWGIGSLEKICLAGNESMDWSEITYIPSMIFFGVAQKEAIWLRMAGVPRVVAGNLAHLWKDMQRHEPSSYETLRAWVTNLSDHEWQRAIPAGMALTSHDMRLVWQSLSGE